MRNWPSVKGSRVFRALTKIGWEIKRHGSGSHLILEKEGSSDYVWAFRNSDEIGPKMLARVAKHTGLKPDDL